ALAVGFGSVALVQRKVARAVRGAAVRPRRAKASVETPPAAATAEPAFLSALRMRSGAPGFVAGTLEVARTELRLLGRHPGLYLFVPLILIQIFGGLVSVGAFDTPLLQTPGTLAV